MALRISTITTLSLAGFLATSTATFAVDAPNAEYMKECLQEVAQLDEFTTSVKENDQKEFKAWRNHATVACNEYSKLTDQDEMTAKAKEFANHMKASESLVPAEVLKARRDFPAK